MVLTISVYCEASIFSKAAGFIGGIFGGGKGGTTIDVSKKNTELENVKAGVIEANAKIDALSGNQISLKDVEKLVDAKIVGYDRSQKAGRDIISVKKNDISNHLLFFC